MCSGRCNLSVECQLPEQQEAAQALLCGTVVPVHPAGRWRAPCPGSCSHCPLSPWGEACWRRPLCPGGLWGHTEASAQGAPPLSSHRLFAPARWQAEEGFSSEKMLSILMQTLMILHHRKKPGGEGKNPKLSKTANICSLWFSQRFLVMYLKDPEKNAQVKRTAPAFCSVTTLQELAGWMQFMVGARLQLNAFVLNANYMHHD